MSEISKNINPRVDVEPLSEGDVWKERHRVQCVINGAQKNHIASLESRLAAAERERDEARELIGKVVEHFKKYADHQWGCPVNGTVEVKKNFRTSGPCRCGFEEALALLSGKEK